MGKFVLDLLLPTTDRVVVIQWIVMGVFWTLVLGWSLRWRSEYRLFAIGLAVINLAWFAVRTVH